MAVLQLRFKKEKNKTNGQKKTPATTKPTKLKQNQNKQNTQKGGCEKEYLENTELKILQKGFLGNMRNS